MSYTKEEIREEASYCGLLTRKCAMLNAYADRIEADERMMADEMVQIAYETWCKPRMENIESDHPFDAFVAGYHAHFDVIQQLKET